MWVVRIHNILSNLIKNDPDNIPEGLIYPENLLSLAAESRCDWFIVLYTKKHNLKWKCFIHVLLFHAWPVAGSKILPLFRVDSVSEFLNIIHPCRLYLQFNLVKSTRHWRKRVCLLLLWSMKEKNMDLGRHVLFMFYSTHITFVFEKNMRTNQFFYIGWKY